MARFITKAQLCGGCKGSFRDSAGFSVLIKLIIATERLSEEYGDGLPILRLRRTSGGRKLIAMVAHRRPLRR